MAEIGARERARTWMSMVGLAGVMAASLSSPGLGAQARGSASLAGSGNSDPAAAAPAFESTIDSLAADLTIRQWRVTNDGTPAGMGPTAMSIRFETGRHGAGWRTALTATGMDKPVVHSLNGPQVLDNPFLVSRLEFDDEGGAPRMYGVRGQLIAGPTDADRRALGLPPSLRNKTWDTSVLLGRIGGPGGRADRPVAAGLISGLADQQRRRADLERRFGSPAGRVRGFDRFVHREGAKIHELLVSAGTSLPVEVIVTVDGQLESRIQYHYESHGSDAVVRRHLRAEQASAGSAGERAVTDVTVSNVTVGYRGAR